MKKLLTLVSLLALSLTGCAEFEEPVAIVSEETEALSNPDPQTRASASYQINPNNPYSLSNVQRALNIVEGSSAPMLVFCCVHLIFGY